MFNLRSKILFIILPAVMLSIIAVFLINRKYSVGISQTYPLVHNQISKVKHGETKLEKQTFPASFLLPIPFTPQAPTANWDTLHNEACEEASIIMTQAYFYGFKESTLSPQYTENELTKITKWETTNFGYFLDINSEEIVQTLKQIYGLQSKLITNFSEESVKTILAKKHLIIWPSNGKKLNNPNFKNGGPPYHVIILKGYNGSTFITNDPGTRLGLNYPYPYQTLYQANGDYNNQTHVVDLTKKILIEVWKD